MKKYISFPRIAGKASRQAHCAIPEGTYEREFGREGFFGPSSHIYHAHKPTGWVSWEGDLRPYAFDMNALAGATRSPWQAATLMHTHTCHVRHWKTSGAMDHLVTNADGDELLFIHSGEGDLFCDFGHLAFRDGDRRLTNLLHLAELQCMIK